MKNTLRNLLIGGLFALTTFVASLLFSTSQAEAISCGAAQCYVESTVKGESNWKESAVVKPGNPAPSPSNFEAQYVGCSFWFTGVIPMKHHYQYPGDQSNTFGCYFNAGLFPGSREEICPANNVGAANGRTNVYYVDPSTGQKTFAYFYCVYPTAEYAPVEKIQGSGKIYVNGSAAFYNIGLTSSTSKINHGAGGTVTDSTGLIQRGVDLANPEMYAGEWRPSFMGRTETLPNGSPAYGFYRLDWTLNYHQCEKWGYPSWINEKPRYDCSQTGTDRIVEPYTYACNFDPALIRGINNSALFRPGECEKTWTCEVDPNLFVGGQLDAISVMRNGHKIPVSYHAPLVTGEGVKNPRNYQVKHSITPGSTPSKEYVWTSFEWDKWQLFNEKQQVAFNWVSDDASKPFSFRNDYRYTADFLLPSQGSISDGTVYKWVEGSENCPGASLSPEIRVLRSVVK